jgi:hypothetical protein
MNNLTDFIKIGDSVLKDLYSKIESSKEHLTDEQKKELDNAMAKATKDISKATALLNDLKNKIND